MQRVKWERGSHIYTWWANRVISKNSHVVCEMRCRFLDTNSGDALYLLVRFQKCVVETRHQFTNVLSMFFSLDTISTKRQKMPMDARRRVLLLSINFPLTTLMINFTVEKLVVGYSRSNIWLIFTNFAILANLYNDLELGVSIVHSKFRILVLEHKFLVGKRFSIMDLMVEISVPIGSSTFLVRAGVFQIPFQLPNLGFRFQVMTFGFGSIHWKGKSCACTLYIFQGYNVDPYFGIGCIHYNKRWVVCQVISLDFEWI
jgi:hypothetical protein